MYKEQTQNNNRKSLPLFCQNNADVKKIIQSNDDTQVVCFLLVLDLDMV